MAKRFIGEVLKKSYKVDYKRLTRTDKQPFLTELFERFAVEHPFTDCLRIMCELIGVKDTTTFYRVSKARGWPEIQKSLREVADRAKSEKDAAAAKEQTVSTDVKFSTIIREVKDFSYQMLQTSHRIAETNSIMIAFYHDKIKKLISQRHGVEYLTTDDSKLIEMWHRNVEFYQEAIKEFVKPSQVSAYLKMAGIEQAVPETMRDIDQTAFTMDRLQQVFMEEFGMVPVLGNEKEIDTLIAKHAEKNLPDIRGYR